MKPMNKKEGTAVLEAFARMNFDGVKWTKKGIAEFFKEHPEKMKDLKAILNREEF